MKTFLLFLLLFVPLGLTAEDKVISIVIGGRLVEIRLPLGKENLPPDKKMYLTYGNETIEINLTGRDNGKFSRDNTQKRNEK